MTKEQLIKFRDLIQKALILSAKDPNAIDTDTLEIIINVGHFLDPEKYEVNKEILNQNSLDRRFRR